MTFHLKEPITCKIGFGDDIWTYECLEFNLLGYANIKEEAFEMFNENFAVIWDNFAKEEDIKLADDAILFKNKLLDIVSDIVYQRS